MLNNDFDDLGLYLGNNDSQDNAMNPPTLGEVRDQSEVQKANLMNDLKNIQQTQQSYGVPTIGDLFRAKPDDIQETINSVYFLMKQRVADIDFRTEVRKKLNKHEQTSRESQENLSKQKLKSQNLTQQIKDIENKVKIADKKAREEREKIISERDELIKEKVKIQNKETQYKHELRSKDVQINKLQETMKTRMFEKKAGGQQYTTNAEFLGPATQNADYKFSKISADSDFHLMISKDQESRFKSLSEENSDLKECLKILQREIMEIVQVKKDVFTQRFKAEYGASKEVPQITEEGLAHQIDTIREELFNVSFEENGRELIQKFKMNFQRLKEFMQAVDKEIAQMAVFSPNDDSNGVAGEFTVPDSIEAGDKYSGVASVQQLKHLLKNYDVLVEGQHHLLNQSITKMAKIPPPDEITATFNRFQVLKDSELDDFRSFLEDHKQILTQQYRDFDQERHSFDEMNKRMENEKVKVSEEREQIESEVRRIRELNLQLQKQMQVDQQ